ncbi:hypothetical protein [Candidatus Mycoplasma haematohominis]|uniref:Uncharacterized protein n=1 Tax=Candidatus Mycoplasma haematohominis TaxID=1494318 RepID=A0A478FT18_9MOLU|nr:hypothetical protein [Candidatus Mycoplasma haemohominis]GCE63150.1 hypothetical protein MHSWG343_01280 [Candidatus Mycoplasma haemohominis]
MLNPPSNDATSLNVSYQAEDPTVALVEPDLKEEAEKEKLELREKEEKEKKEKDFAEKKKLEEAAADYVDYLDAVAQDRYQRKLDEQKKQEEERKLAEKKKLEEAAADYVDYLDAVAQDRYQQELDKTLEGFKEFLLSALSGEEGGVSEEVERIREKRSVRRDGGKSDRKELLSELKKLAIEAKSKLRTDFQGFFDAGSFLDDLIRADEKIMNFRELKYFLGNLKGCTGMWKSNSGGCDD